MRAAAQDALAGHTATIIVDGPPGIGRSTLLDELRRRSSEFRPITIAGFADEANLPYALVTQLALTLRSWGHDPDWAQITAVGDPIAVGMTLLEGLAAAAADSSVMLLVDDAQWIDPESAVALRFVLRRLIDERVCAVVAIDSSADRSGHVHAGDLTTGPASVAVTLTGLDLTALGELVRVHVGRDDESLVRRLSDWAAGNPALAWALLTDPSWVHGSDTQPPVALAAGLRAVVSRMPPGCGEVLDALAIVRNPARLSTLRAVCDDETASDLDGLVEPLLEARLIRWHPPGRDSLEFVNSALRHSTRQGLNVDRQRRLHTAAARATTDRAEALGHLVAAAAGPEPALAEMLDIESRLEVAAGNQIRASRYTLWASEVSAGPDDRARRLTHAVRLLVRAGRNSAALDLSERVGSLRPGWERDEAAGLLAFAQGQLAAALTALTRAEQTCSDQATPLERARIAVEISVVAVMLFSGELAVEASSRARALTDEPDVARLAAATGAFGHGVKAGPDAALVKLDYLPAEPAECPDLDLTALTFRGLFRGLVGRFDEAIADLTVAARRREFTKTALFGVAAHNHLAWCQAVTGLWQTAERTLGVAGELAAVYGRAFDHAALRSALAVNLAWQGKLTQAREAVDASEQLAQGLDYLAPMFHQTLARASIAWAEGAWTEILALLAPLRHHQVDRARIGLFAIWWMPALAEAQLSTRRSRDADDTVEELATIDSIPGGLRDTAAAWLRGRMALGRGDVTTALGVLSDEASRPGFHVGQNMYSGLLVQTLADATYAAGDHAGARTLFESALHTFESTGAAPLVERCRLRMSRLFRISTQATPTVLDRLSEREGQVAVLVGRGWTNAEIASSLFVSVKAVEYHLRNIFMKLNLTRRRQLRLLLEAPVST